MKRTKIAELIGHAPENQKVLVQGWVKSHREYPDVSFVALNDGSTIKTMQIVLDANFKAEYEAAHPDQDYKELMKSINTGAAISVVGHLVPSEGKGQTSEVKATGLKVFSPFNPDFPLQKKGATLEFLREKMHLRPRSNTFGAVFRIRSAAAFAIHKFFTEKGFFYVHTPIITGSDTEGAGELFHVTTLPLNNIPKTADGEVDYEQDFFGKSAHLTVSGQLNGETFAMALGDIYTFGPTFRAENSNTSRHLAEFWMVEPEMAFYDIEMNQDLAEEFIKYVIQYVMDHCADDLEFFDEFGHTLNQGVGKRELKARLNFVLKHKFKRITYTEAVEILQSASKKFEYPVKWGSDLQSEHERYLVEDHFKKPVIVTDYPKDIKAFYMKLNDDGKTVRGMDVLFPGIGEIIGGSQREEDYDKLVKRIHEMGLPEEEYWWYLDTRRFGSAPHSGFGLGFARLLMFLTGMTNIRDVIPFPRYPRNAEF
ncbi:MAG: asparagine--tRNA ligase [Bacteroidia bacterium]|nr:asparagine--tRNA ligase [Bacteroidia bacterium]